MTNWNYADVFEAVAARVGDAPAQLSGDRVLTWRDFNDRANRLAADLLASGLGDQAKVAAYLHNGPEYLETYFAAFKAGMAPVNTNYRYGPDEIVYLFDNADAEAVVFHSTFADLLDTIRARLPRVRRWYVVDDPGSGVAPCPDWAVPYDSIVAGDGLETENIRGRWGRNGDQILLLYTGGTTGMPKGVMWRQDDLFNVLGAGGSAITGSPPCLDMDDFTTRLATAAPGGRVLPACPLMHGTGQFTAFMVLAGGGSVVTIPNRSFDPAELFSTIERADVQMLVIVGDAFAKPMLATLDANPGRWDLSRLAVITSSGVMWSQETKRGMLAHLPNTALFDSFGSSEAVGMGVSVSAAGAPVETAKFQQGPTVKVLTEEGKPVTPGSDETGFVAISGFLPTGYYKDPEKSAKTFRTFDGVRYSVPGDFAAVNADGSLRLLGRGSVCINTGGEKVFPEEVEEALKLHDLVRDAVCVGVPDDRFGEVIVAVVEAAEPAPGDTGGHEIDADTLIEHVRGRLARYKAPRFVLTVATIGRSPAGKVDYKRLQAYARDQLGR